MIFVAISFVCPLNRRLKLKRTHGCCFFGGAKRWKGPITGLKKYQKIVRDLRERDVSEADTVTVVKDTASQTFTCLFYVKSVPTG